ncbi:MAG: hypothetical protein ACJAX4_004690, partial [Clostridium sp.]
LVYISRYCKLLTSFYCKMEVAKIELYVSVGANIEIIACRDIDTRFLS